MARGSVSPDAMKEMLAAAGIDVSFTPLAIEPGAFFDLAKAAEVPGAKLVRLTGKMKDGESMTALLVVNIGQ